MDVYLIGCVKKKQTSGIWPVYKLYTSPLFGKELEYAQSKVPRENIFVISAKYYLVGLDEMKEPYDTSLNNMSMDDKVAWGNKVFKILNDNFNLDDLDLNFKFLAGKWYVASLVGLQKIDPKYKKKEYRGPLCGHPKITNWSRPVIDGLRDNPDYTGMGIGCQMRWLDDHKKKNDEQSSSV